MDHLTEAKGYATGSCRSTEVERGQLHAAIATVEALQDIRSAIELFNGKLDAILRQRQTAPAPAEGFALMEAAEKAKPLKLKKPKKAKATRRKAAK